MLLKFLISFLLVLHATASWSQSSSDASADDISVELLSDYGVFDDLLHGEHSFLNIQPLDTSDQVRESFHIEGLHADVSFATPTCQLFSTYLTTPALALTSTCANAVPYSFYLPANTPLTFLEKSARSILNNTALTLFPTTCQAAIKKLVCANIYLPCAAGAVPTDATKTNWNPFIYSDLGSPVSVPFQRPCQQVCNDVNSKCFGILSLLGVGQNCSVRQDYSGGILLSLPLQPFRYDAGNNPAVCNLMTTSFVVGSQRENYLAGASGQCAGIVDSLYVVPASRASPSFAPMQSTGVVQSFLENTLQSYFDLLPVFVSASCRFALKKYFCRTTMPSAAALTFEQAFADSSLTSRFPALANLGVNVTEFRRATVYFPAFASQEVCQDYTSECAEFRELANRPQLTPDCAGTTVFGGRTVEKYPSTTQTVISLPVRVTTPVGAVTLAVNFRADPDSVSSATMVGSSYTTYCPDGYVVPDDPSDSRIRWVTGTGCAVACRVPTYTDSEFDAEDLTMHILAVIGIPATFFVFCIYMIDEKRRREGQTVILFSVYAFVNAVSYVILRTTPSAEVCANNAVGLQSEDGASICTVTSFINMYCIFGCCMAWMLFSVDKFLKIVVGMKGTFLWEFNIIAVVLYPLIAVIGSARLDLWGYSNGPKQCVFNGQNPKNFDLFAIFIIPTLALVITAFVSKVIVIMTVSCTSCRRDISPSMKQKQIQDVNSSSQDVGASSSSQEVAVINEEQKDKEMVLGAEGVDDAEQPAANMSAGVEHPPHNLTEVFYEVNDISYDHSVWDLITAVTFTLIFFFLWIVVLYFRINGYRSYDLYYDSFQEWTQCAFANFNYPSQDWRDDCGVHPEERARYGVHFLNFIFIGGQGTIFAAIFLSNPALWYELYQMTSSYFNGNRNSGDNDKMKAGDNGNGFIEIPTTPAPVDAKTESDARSEKFKRRQTANVELGEVFDEHDGVDDFENPTEHHNQNESFNEDAE